MSSSNTSSSSSCYVGPPVQKRIRSDDNPFGPGDHRSHQCDDEYHHKDHKEYHLDKEKLFGTFETATTVEREQFDELKHHDDVDVDDHCCVVESRNGGGRHLFSSPPYATAAVSNNNDTELLSNGDSGFQELNIPDELNISEKQIMNSKIVNDNETDVDVTMKKEDNLIQGGSLMAQQTIDKNSNDDDDDDDSFSEFSYASDLSNISGEGWKPLNHLEWIQKQIENGTDPKGIIQNLTGQEIISEIDSLCAWRFLIRMLGEISVRNKLNTVNFIDDVIGLIQKSSKIIVLTGAGVSVSCGIPDFRSRNGIYARLSKDYPDLPDPQSMFDIHYFKKNPYPFFKFAKEIYPGQFQPSASHKFIKYIEIKRKLLRNYSQNIDTLEKTAGIENVITCHGSFATATCTVCGYKVDSSTIQSEIFAQKIPLCTKCIPESNNGNDNILPLMKPDIVFFGEGLSDEFHNSMTVDKNQCDLLIVIGSSLKVRPVALIPNSIPENIPQILINREPLNHFNFDVELLGDCDVIIKHLCKRLGKDWLNYCFPENIENEEINLDDERNKDYEFIPPSRYIFKGAEINDSYDSDDDSNNEENDFDESDSNIEEMKIEYNNSNNESITAIPQNPNDDLSDLSKKFSPPTIESYIINDDSTILSTNVNEKESQELKINHSFLEGMNDHP